MTSHGKTRYANFAKDISVHRVHSDRAVGSRPRCGALLREDDKHADLVQAGTTTSASGAKEAKCIRLHQCRQVLSVTRPDLPTRLRDKEAPTLISSYGGRGCRAAKWIIPTREFQSKDRLSFSKLSPKRSTTTCLAFTWRRISTGEWRDCLITFFHRPKR